MQLYPHQQTALEETAHFNRVAYYLDMGEFVDGYRAIEKWEEREDEAIETEAVEMCPDCGRENVYPNWKPEDGWRQKCQNCGEMILLCDECLHADDNSGRICDWDNITCKCFRDRR